MLRYHPRSAAVVLGGALAVAVVVSAPAGAEHHGHSGGAHHTSSGHAGPAHSHGATNHHHMSGTPHHSGPSGHVRTSTGFPSSQQFHHQHEVLGLAKQEHHLKKQEQHLQHQEQRLAREIHQLKNGQTAKPQTKTTHTTATTPARRATTRLAQEKHHLKKEEQRLAREKHHLKREEEHLAREKHHLKKEEHRLANYKNHMTNGKGQSGQQTGSSQAAGGGTTGQGMPQTVSTSNDPGGTSPGSSSQTANNSSQRRGRVEVYVPHPSAVLYVNGSKTKTSGTHRVFATPELSPGKRYAYHVVAHWHDEGHELREERTVHVTAGQTARVRFRDEN